MKTEIQIKLENIARARTIPFCYNDYAECPSGRCLKCGSDDLMMLLRGVGCEYGLDWVIKHILQEELAPAEIDDAFESMMRDCYPANTTIGFLQDYDTVDAIKKIDPIAWDLAKSEYVDSLESDGEILSFDGGVTYYWVRDLEALE